MTTTTHPTNAALARVHARRAIERRFVDTARKAGATVHGVNLLGQWLHIRTTKGSEGVLREILGIMKADSIRVLQPGADGKHLDGGADHRMVAVFEEQEVAA